MLNTFRKSCAVAALLAAAAMAVSFSSVRAQESPGSSLAQVESGITKPYEERKLQFAQPAIVTELKIKVGETVEAGQVLGQQDITIEQAERAGLEIEATSTVQEEYAKADQGVNEQKYARLQELLKTSNASKFEVEEARLAVERSKSSVKLAVQERETAKTKIRGVDARITLKTLKSPIGGFIQQIDTGVGEMGGVDQQKPSIVIVQNDPLKVDVNVPIREANRLQKGQVLEVRYTDVDNGPWQPAKILSMLPVADRGSQTRGVVLELANPQNKPAGLRVEVRLAGDAPPAAADAGRQ
jgi:multidrug efflux pump subunit AcrA (membrane-fusion protein)